MLSPASPGGGEAPPAGRWLIPFLSAGNFVIGMGAFVVIGLIDPLAAGLAVSRGEAGLALTVYALAYAIGSPLGIALTGGVARRRLLMAGLAAFALAALGTALASGLVPLLAARVLAAFGAGLFTPTAAAVAVAAAPPERRATALANVFFGLTLAQVLGIPAGSWLAATFGWEAAFLVVAGLAVPVLAGLWRAVPADLPFQPTRLATLAAALGDRRAMGIVLYTATFLAAVYIPFTFLGPILSETMGLGGGGIALALLVYGFGAVAGNLVGGRLADRIGPRRTLYGLAAAQVALMPLLAVLPLPLPLAFGLIFLWSACGWSFLAPQQARLVAFAPDRAPVLLALNAAAIYVGAALGSAVGAAVLAASDLGALGLAGGIAALLALAHLRATAEGTAIRGGSV